MEDNLIYLDTYVLQQDMRIRLPKSILTNLYAKKGKTRFAVFLDTNNRRLVLVADASVKENIDESDTQIKR